MRLFGIFSKLCVLLLFFLQLALILREWFLKQENDAFSSSFIVDGKYEKLECQTGNGDFYLRHLLYASLLLAFQLLISPCIVASRRNYREGLLFALASFSTLMVWIGWTSAFYIFVEEKWQDVSICCGLLATPTVIILVVFIPKVRWRLCPNPFSLNFYNFPVLSFNDNKCFSRL